MQASFSYNDSLRKLAPIDMPVNLKPLLIGGVTGAATAVVSGFALDGGGTVSKEDVDENARSDKTVVMALAPIGVGKYRQSAVVQVQCTALCEVDTWPQATFIGKAGWAEMPGSALNNLAMAQACAKKVLKEQL